MHLDRNGYYEWHPPGAGVKVHLAFDVIDRILPDVLRGFGSIPKRGAEVGGVLFGRAEGSEVWIDAHEAIACDYATGPSYFLQGKDLGKFEEALRGGKKPIGFYRSDTRDELKLAGPDLELMERFFPSDSALALLIRPYATKVSRAGFFLRRDGTFPAETPLDFPFSRKLLGGGRANANPAPHAEAAPPTAIEPVVEEPVDEPSSVAEVEVPAAPPIQRSPQKARWAAALALAVGLGWSAGYFTARQTPPPPDLAVYSLGLTLEQETGQVRLKWNRQSLPMRGARRGELRVEQAGQSKVVPLEIDQLRMGEALYLDGGSSARLELRVIQATGSMVSETVNSIRR